MLLKQGFLANDYAIPINQLAEGVYFLQLIDVKTAQRSTAKFIKP